VLVTTCRSWTYTSQLDLAEGIRGCQDTAKPHVNIFNRSRGSGKAQLTGKGQILHPSRKRAKKKFWELTDESASPESLEKLWNGSSRKLFPGMKEKAPGRSQHRLLLTQPSPTVSSSLFASSLLPSRPGRLTCFVKIKPKEV